MHSNKYIALNHRKSKDVGGSFRHHGRRERPREATGSEENKDGGGREFA